MKKRGPVCPLGQTSAPGDPGFSLPFPLNQTPRSRAVRAEEGLAGRGCLRGRGEPLLPSTTMGILISSVCWLWEIVHVQVPLSCSPTWASDRLLSSSFLLFPGPFHCTEGMHAALGLGQAERVHLESTSSSVSTSLHSVPPVTGLIGLDGNPEAGVQGPRVLFSGHQGGIRAPRIGRSSAP